MMEWLLSEEALHELQAIHRAGIVPTAEQLERFEARSVFRGESAEMDEEPSNLTIIGPEAQINIQGILTERTSFMNFLMDERATSYAEIRQALASADGNPAVKRAVLNINSRGGDVDGLFETIAAIEQFSKPLKVRASKALSAAFALAAAGGKIEAVGKASQFGSIGVIAKFKVFEDEVTISNTDSPEKAPDPSTEEGQASIRARLDEMNTLFVEAIAAGRTRAGKPISASAVKTRFGRGASLLAKASLEAGMIDKIATAPRATRPRGARAEDSTEMHAVSADGGATWATQTTPTELPVIETEPTAADGGGENTVMTIEELQAQHPGIYQAIFALGADGTTAAREAGVTAERDRINAHLTMGQASGDMDTALSAVADGSEMTETLRAKYYAAGMNRDDVTARAADSADAATATAGAEAPPAAPTKDIGDHVLAAFEAGI